MAFITWDKALLAKFKLAVKEAKDNGHDTFEFEANIFLVRYAEYLIEYLGDRLK